ncbi:Shikimate kinase [Sporomusa carbonis]|uniref:shikimate kinase n=1 Tax=Sporomusa carbonis TaxID=3076075 RepID=UPI003A6B2BD1
MLDKLRLEIDSFDAVLTETLYRRFAAAARVAAYKKERGLAVYQPEREAAVLNKIAGIMKNKSFGVEIQELYRHIFQLSRRVQIHQVFPYNMVFIGFMGSGKSTIGRYLAEISGYNYYDVDTMIEQQAGQSVQEIFSIHGEKHFRSLEREVVERLRTVDHAVIACGGGVVLDAANVSHLKEKGKFIWLKAAPETVYERLKHQNNRPLIKDKNFDDIKNLLKSREGLYGAVADYEVATDGKLISDIGHDIMNMITNTAK